MEHMDGRIEPIPEVDLNAEAVKFGAVYRQTQLKGPDLATNALAHNAAIHGFFAGVRWFERYQLGLNPPSATNSKTIHARDQDP